jgi:subtilase family serine protease
MSLVRRTAVIAGATALTCALGLGAIASATYAADHGRPSSVHPSRGLPNGLIGTTTPPTTADCEQQFQLACFSPTQIRQAYNLGPLYSRGIDGKGQTIVIVDPFGSPTIQNDLAVFDQAFDLPAPPSFKIIQPDGPVPSTTEWAGETTLDVEYAHAIAPGANIILAETPTDESTGTAGFPEIVQAEKYVIDRHLATVISQSFGTGEQTFASAQSLLELRGAYTDAAAHGVTVVSSSGDNGPTTVGADESTFSTSPVIQWPASDPLVTAVGGTHLSYDPLRGTFGSSTVWNDTFNVAANQLRFGNNGPNPRASGGGMSSIFARPPYQHVVAATVDGSRGIPDISMNASEDGFAIVYHSYSTPGFYNEQGTSEAAPMFAGIVALAAQVAGHKLGQINPAIYGLYARHAPGIVDVTSGNTNVAFTQNGTTFNLNGFDATLGYDLATGVGTLNAALFVPELAAAAA